MAKAVKFTRESAARIAKTVRRDETRQGGTPPGRTNNVCFEWNTILFGKTDATHNKNASGTISVWSHASSASSLADTGDNITAYNRFGNIASGKFVACWSAPWGWEIISAEC